MFAKKGLVAFRAGYDKAMDVKDASKRKQLFKGIAIDFAKDAAKSAGGTVLAVVKGQLGL